MESDSIRQRNSWLGVWALAFGISAIMIADFLPSGVLTLMARSLSITEGLAGQSVTATSLSAVVSSLLVPYLTRRIDRKLVLIGLSVLTGASCFLVGLAPNFLSLALGRVLLGISLGGYWSLAAALAIRLVEPAKAPHALGIIFGTSSFSAMLSAPLGSFLGEFISWRQIFLINSGYAILGLVFILLALPTLAPKGETKLSDIFKVLKIPSVKIGLLATGLAFCGRFASTTYLRPYLEQDVGLQGIQLSIMFLAFDIAYFIGAVYAGRFVGKSLRISLSLPPVLLAISSFGLIYLSNSIVWVGLILLLRGAVFAPIPVSWSTWGTKVAPENTETIGGLYVASIQLFAAIGASIGGYTFDLNGAAGVFVFSSNAWIISAFLVIYFVKTNFKNEKSKHIGEKVYV